MSVVRGAFMSINSIKGAHASREPFAAELIEFAKHKPALLGSLHSAYQRGPMSEPFDADKSWDALTRAARWYFRRSAIKHETMLPARRVERLHDLAKALNRARKLAIQNVNRPLGVIDSDLFMGWCAEANISSFALDAGEASLLTRVTDELKKAVECLTSLQAAASRAARNISRKPGSPGGNGILSPHDLGLLMGVYERSTGQKPSVGAGPFAELVEKFLVAVGQSDRTSNDYVDGALKYRRRQIGQHK
jgi:hypothetical protein